MKSHDFIISFFSILVKIEVGSEDTENDSFYCFYMVNKDKNAISS